MSRAARADECVVYPIAPQTPVPPLQNICHSGILEYRMVRVRTSRSDQSAQAVDGAVAAFESVGITAETYALGPSEAIGSPEVDAVLHVFVDDRSFYMVVEAVSYCTGQYAVTLIERMGPSADTPPLLVADRITGEARTILTKAGWSWLDRRGWLHLHAPGVRIDVAVPAAGRATGSTAASPIAGRSGITIAYWLCTNPGESVSPNRSSGLLHLAPSTISTTVRRLAEAGLVNEVGAAIAPELFWELASVWRTDRTWLLASPDPKLQLPVDRGAPSWRITGTAAAAWYGAPVAAAGKGPTELYVTGPVEISIATRRYGAAEPGTGSAVISVPPTSLVIERGGNEDVLQIDGWPIAPVVAVALDLAQDRTRGREILEDWKAGDGIWI
jgi:hypothetical protein